MSNKAVKLSPEEKQRQEDEAYLKGRPTRAEVANYVNGLLETKFLPEVLGQIQLGMMVLQAILIQKGICTGEEIEEVTKEFLEKFQAEKDKNQEQIKNM